MQRYFILIAVLILLLAACGGDESAATTTSTPSTTPPPTTVGSDAVGGGAATGDLVAQDGDTVEVHYVRSLDDGTESDSSRGGEPFDFVLGTEQVIAGFDEAVRGMAVGDTVTVRIPPEEAYGDIDPELVFSVPIDQAPDDVAEGDEVLIGGITPGVVTLVTATEVTIDTNHRFAGMALTFEIEVISISR
jgi:FKBP-type peptidyl-prolyl cis-trans isomerase 2